MGTGFLPVACRINFGAVVRSRQTYGFGKTLCYRGCGSASAEPEGCLWPRWRGADCARQYCGDADGAGYEYRLWHQCGADWLDHGGAAFVGCVHRSNDGVHFRQHAQSLGSAQALYPLGWHRGVHQFYRDVVDPQGQCFRRGNLRMGSIELCHGATSFVLHHGDHF